MKQVSYKVFTTSYEYIGFISYHVIDLNLFFNYSPGYFCVGNISILDHEDRCAVR